jgi:DNA primase
MAIGSLLERLQGVRRTGDSKWVARCPAHEDKSPSLSLSEKNGIPLIHCFAGCEPLAILEAVGLSWPDILPEKLDRESHQRPIRNVQRVAEERARAEVYLETLKKMIDHECYIPTQDDTRRAKACLQYLKSHQIPGGW